VEIGGEAFLVKNVERVVKENSRPYSADKIQD